MTRVCLTMLLLVGLWMCLGGCATGPAPVALSEPPVTMPLAQEPGIAVPLPGPPASSAPPSTLQNDCCRICRIGKPCGDDCIAVDKSCDKPPGCACDGS
jgi:hypothetical protein